MSSSKMDTLQAAIAECGGQRERIRGFAREIVAGLSEVDAPDGESALDVFITELVLSAADHRRLAERKRHQMECIAAAKARGVRFGAARKPLPDNFDDCYEAWRDGEMTLSQAAEACGMVRTSFRRAIDRMEQAV